MSGENNKPLQRTAGIEHAGSPDHCARAFLNVLPDAARYDYLDYSPHEAPMTIARLVPRKARVLDVGCGCGGVAQIIREVSASCVVGIEPDPARAARARARGIVVHQGFLTPDSARSLGTFDVVVFADVLEHLADPTEVVRVAAGVLKEEGIMIISVPNAAHWSVRCNLLRGRFEYQPFGIMDATHLRWFTKASLQSFCARVGLEITTLRYTLGSQLPVYRRAPWAWLSSRPRDAFLWRLVRWFPGGFACQFVVVAHPRRAQLLASTMRQEPPRG